MHSNRSWTGDTSTRCAGCVLKRIIAATLLTIVTACSNGTVSPDPPPTTPASTALPSNNRASAERIADRFLHAANSGNRDATAALFADSARFDSVGRIYASRDDIMNRFLIPEVLETGGRYHVTRTDWAGDRYVVAYEFTTSSGGREQFTYAYLIRDGLIHDVIGRYR
jgi:hypothetical protein